MAPQRVLKSLNKGPGKKRFVFKSFAQRVDEVDVDVFRSLAPVKFEPTSGSSFFHENLLRWRELNAAADFNAVYVDLLPKVQTLPLLLLHKDAIMKSLLSRVRLSAMLSLEPILSLIGILSRDLREEFLPYMPKFFDTCSDLLKMGGDQEPDILEQVFVSISYVIKYLMKSLAKDICFLLRVTKSLRYYSRTFVQDFAAESVSYLLRKAPPKQLIKGVRRLFAEVEADPGEVKISSSSTLLFHTLKGPASGLHSQAEPLLHLLLDRSTLSSVQRERHGARGKLALQVVSKTFLLLCEHINREKLDALWDCLLEHISAGLLCVSSPSDPQPGLGALGKDPDATVLKNECLDDGHGLGSDSFEEEPAHILQDSSLHGQCGPGPPLVVSNGMPDEDDVNFIVPPAKVDEIHLVHLLSLVTDIIEFRKGSRVNDYKPLFAIVPRLIELEVHHEKQPGLVHHLSGPLAPSRLLDGWPSEYLSEVLRFMLALLKSHAQVAGASAGPGAIALVAPTWAAAFESNEAHCLLPFLRGLMTQHVSLIQIFAPEIVRCLDVLIEEHAVEVLPLLLDASQTLQSGALLPSISNMKRLKSSVVCLIQESMKGLRAGGVLKNNSENVVYIQSLAVDPAVVWMALKCLPYIVTVGEEQASLVWAYVGAIELFLSSEEWVGTSEESENISYKCLLATALSSHTQLLTKWDAHALVQYVNSYLDLAILHKSSPHVLEAVGNLLDSAQKGIVTGPAYASTKLFSLLEDFLPNLSVPDKSLRTATLKLLAHFELLQTTHDADQSPSKRQKSNSGQASETQDSVSAESFQQLLEIESATLSHENFRRSTVLLTSLRVAACTRKVPDCYVVPLVNALIGVLHNRFSLLWDPAVEVLASMLEVYGNTVGQVLVSHLELIQNLFLVQGGGDRIDDRTGDFDLAPDDLWTRFDSYLHNNSESTQIGTFLSLLLKTLQKVARFAEARSRQLIPLFLMFVGHSECSEDIHAGVLRSGKDWKISLKEWLILIKEMRNAQSLFQGPIVKEILLTRFLSDSDPAIQQICLECLLNWREKYLVTNEEHLKNLISSRSLREELTTWDVSKEGHLVHEEDREPLLTVVLFILFPKIMRRTTKSLGKSGVGVQRNAVLSFLARLESSELAPLFAQLMKPFQSAFTDQPSKDAWMSMLVEGVTARFIYQVDSVAVADFPHKRKLGFLHMVMDSLEIFNRTQLTRYLFALFGIVFRILETSAMESKDQRALCSASNEASEENPVTEDKCHLGDNLESTTGCQAGDRMEMSMIPDRAAKGLVENEPAISIEENFETIELNGGSCNGLKLFPRPSQQVILNNSNGLVSVKPTNGGKLSLLDEELGASQCSKHQDGGLVEDLHSSTPKYKVGGVREIRNLSLRILATVVRKFENIEFPPLYWDIFFHTIKQSVSRFVSENSFINAPSALMQCFLAMSQRMELAPLLTRDPALIPNILLIIAVKGVSPEVVSFVLSFVENILDLVIVSDVHEETSVVREILLPHLDVLLSSFGTCLSFHRETSSERRSLKRELKIVTRISKYIKNEAIAAKLVHVLLPMLKVKKRMDQEICLEVLRLLQGMGQILPTSSAMKCVPALAPFLVSVSIQDVRVAVAETLMVLATVDHTLLNVAELVRDLNAMSSTTVDEFDYGHRFIAYDRLSGSFSQLTPTQAILVLSHVIFDMRSEDMSIRHRASDCLQKFVQFAASVPEIDQEQFFDKVEEFPQTNADLILDTLKIDDEKSVDVITGTMRSLVISFLVPHVRNGMGSDLLVVRREWVLLLRHMATNIHGPALKEYQSLINNDVEADFFHNIVHLQVHRRIKAMSKFKEVCSSSQFSQGALSRIFVPLFMNSLFDARGDKEGNLVTLAVESLACIATQLPWEPYFGLLMRSFRLLASKTDHQKVLVRLICAILDAFHFFGALSGDDTEAEAHTKSEISEKDQIANSKRLLSIHDTVEQGTLDQVVVPQLTAEVQNLLRRRVLPEIRRLMVSKGGIVSTPVALTLVKILKLMPESITEVELPQVIRTVVNALKSRSQAVRDEARAALVAITETLGANYLYFVIDVLRSSLMKGFELHVLGYTLNSILIKLVPKVKVGEIDYCLEQLLEVLENDVMGEVAEEKDVEAIAVKMKETKHMRSYESMGLLAQVVTFRTQSTALIGPVRRNLQKSLAPKVLPKLEKMLQHIAAGLQHNSSVSQSDLLVIVYAMVEDGLKEEQAMALAAAAKKQARIDKLASVNISTDDIAQATKASIPNFYLITDYALQLLQSHLKRAKVNPQDVETLGMLDPLVVLLQKCLNSKYDSVLASTLRVLTLLLLLPLPAIHLHGSQITTLVLGICQRFAKTESSLLQACLNVLVILIRHCKSLRLSQDQLRAVLQFPIFIDMESGSRIALSLLRSIVSQRLLVPELYDVINRVGHLMVTSNAAPVRQLCSQILLQFLLDYPLGKKRLEQHLDFFITNIGYDQTSGREAALEMLHTIILKFPDVVVEEHIDSMFFPLVTRLVNDDSNQVRSMIGTILKVLMGRVSPRSVQRMTDFAISWYKGTDRQLWRTAAQVIGFLIEVKGAAFERYAEDILPQCFKILDQANFPPNFTGTEFDKSGKSVSWQDAYFSLTMMEKLLQQLPIVILLPDLKEFWMFVTSLLLHQHIWIRKVCGRILGIYLGICGVPTSQKLESCALSKEDIMLFHPSWVLLLVASLCQQIDTGPLDEEMGVQIVKNLEILGCSLPILPQSASKQSEKKLSLLGCDDAQSADRVAKALVLLGWEETSQRSPSGLENETREHGLNLFNEATETTALWLVFKKLEKIALRVHPMQTKVILHWYAAIAPKLHRNDMEKHLTSMLTVLTKLTEGSAARVVPEDVKSLADEVLSQLREWVGAVQFVNVYNEVREKGKENRNRRKSEQKISVLVDPERNAKRKIRMAAKRQTQKKRRIIKGKAEMGL